MYGNDKEKVRVAIGQVLWLILQLMTPDVLLIHPRPVIPNHPVLNTAFYDAARCV